MSYFEFLESCSALILYLILFEFMRMFLHRELRNFDLNNLVRLLL